jgi:hypothetical protein
VRSELIFRARETVDNKYRLCQTVAKATRRLHIAAKNTEDTINEVLSRIAGGDEFSPRANPILVSSRQARTERAPVHVASTAQSSRALVEGGWFGRNRSLASLLHPLIALAPNEDQLAKKDSVWSQGNELTAI